MKKELTIREKARQDERSEMLRMIKIVLFMIVVTIMTGRLIELVIQGLI